MKDYKSLYFVGAGGIGMAALERYFLAKGKKVAGYDRTPSELTQALEQEGVEIVYDENPDLIPSYCRDKDSTLVVYTPAVPSDHAGLCYFRDNGFEVVKRAKVLGIITHDSKALCFAGTHGKTTTSSMAAHILEVSGIGSNAFLGGVLRNYDSNFLLSSTSEFSVIEADEFDRSFHHLSPYIAVVTSTDADHLDIYGTYENYLESFAHFTSLIRPGGALIVHTGLDLKPRVADGVKIYTYSKHEGDFHAARIRKGNGEIVFDFVTPWETIEDIKLGVPVDINIENSIAAMAACRLASVPATAMREAIGSFMGAKRRFEFWLKEPGEHGKVVIDDYAHHPSELEASIKSVRDLYPGRKISVVFQPHLYTRTRDFAPEFAQALSLAD
ncbi:MAG: UDP-N-acetylmuramate--L-alanine ligase, partial [Muribaculaceae bacterium]|nr:UDP-N-acetylmuramate--L-alanine ligase [Muribaculaceae bacterium]